MKMQDEDLGRERQAETLTDDEENQADSMGEIEDDSGSESSSTHSTPTRNPSDGIDIQPTWPQSYRQSMDIYSTVTSPSLGFLKPSSLSALSGSMSSLYKRSQPASYLESSLSKPLISDLEKEEVLSPRVHWNVPSRSRLSNISDMPRSRMSSIIDSLPPARKCSLAQSCLNGINVLCGVGLLATPYAIKEGGWSSLSLLFIFGIIAFYTGILLQECLDSAPGLTTYPDVGQAAFGITGRLIVAAASIEYLIMMSDNLASLFPHTSMNFGGLHLDCHKIFSITATLVVLPTVWLRDLTLLSYISVGGVITTGVVVLCLLWIGVVDAVGFHPYGTALDLSNLPVTIGLYGFAYAGHSVFPNIYSSMQEPKKFPFVLMISFVFCSLLNAGVGICGYLMFGDSIQSQFTLNFPKEFVASKVAIWTTVLIPMSKYAMTLTPIALSLEELMPSKELQSYSVSVIIRTILAISTLVVALTLPYFGIVMSLIGSLLAMLIIAFCIFNAILGVFCACIGTYSALSRIATRV
ncbi:Amino acid transporter AVT1D [Citrus sinensis]|uniref:Amino acid transporter AVT1D n=1 Tax=Citrus sinensis TaxID=2711 RepID=A0ACB8JTE7_CITSI|nr:Amino acid transporter AVT1D [Citrus sinensis]